ncbi:MAG: hypothetical protein MSC30_08260 [Gaiellaceae bacterium MAG52_C11]|nr:hypothetical protein [Candidatus Gaiellasilicea maunaloa]
MDVAHAERLARNESLFREVNERINEVAGSLSPDDLGADDHRYEFVCECSDPHCTERLVLSRGEYDQVRADGTRFVLAHGHVTAEIEHVVERTDDYVVIEKEGVAAEVATGLDPRTT